MRIHVNRHIIPDIRPLKEGNESVDDGSDILIADIVTYYTLMRNIFKVFFLYIISVLRFLNAG